MFGLKEITEFVSIKNLALVGYSRNEKSFSRILAGELSKKGYNVVGVNPNFRSESPFKCVETLEEAAKTCESVLILSPKNETDTVFQQAVDLGINHIWIQQGTETKDLVDKIRRLDKPIIFQKCILMFLPGIGGIHRFHGKIVRFFGKYPK